MKYIIPLVLLSFFLCDGISFAEEKKDLEQDTQSQQLIDSSSGEQIKALAQALDGAVGTYKEELREKHSSKDLVSRVDNFSEKIKNFRRRLENYKKEPWDIGVEAHSLAEEADEIGREIKKSEGQNHPLHNGNLNSET